jgi:ribonuclease P protein component
MDRLTKRAEFLAVARGVRSARRGFVLQAAKAFNTGSDAAPASRCGFTVTKKVGNAVVRNRIRRRLKEVVRLTAAGQADTGVDYVLVGRVEALALPFSELVRDLADALRQVRGRLKSQASGDGNEQRQVRPKRSGTDGRTEPTL